MGGGLESQVRGGYDQNTYMHLGKFQRINKNIVRGRKLLLVSFTFLLESNLSDFYIKFYQQSVFRWGYT